MMMHHDQNNKTRVLARLAGRLAGARRLGLLRRQAFPFKSSQALRSVKSSPTRFRDGSKSQAARLTVHPVTPAGWLCVYHAILRPAVGSTGVCRTHASRALASTRCLVLAAGGILLGTATGIGCGRKAMLDRAIAAALKANERRAESR